MDILTSLHGKRLGLDRLGRLILNSPLLGAANRRAPYLAYANEAASAAISNTTAETAFDTSYSIPAKSLQPGELIKVRYQGIATATNGTDTLTVRLRLGGVAGTALLVSNAVDVVNNDIFAGEAEIIIRTIGASGTFVAAGTHINAPAGSGTAVHDIVEITASTAIDTTAAQVINATAQWSVASAANSCRLDIMRVERW